MSDIFDDAALRVAGNFSEDDKQFALDPTTVLVILDILTKIVGMWANCKATGKVAKQTADNPSPMQRLLVRRRVKETMGGRDFRSHGEKVMQALFQAGQDADESYLQKLIDEV